MASQRRDNRLQTLCDTSPSHNALNQTILSLNQLLHQRAPFYSEHLNATQSPQGLVLMNGVTLIHIKNSLHVLPSHILAQKLRLKSRLKPRLVKQRQPADRPRFPVKALWSIKALRLVKTL